MSKLALLRNTKLFEEKNLKQTKSLIQTNPEALDLLQNIFMEMDDCSILILTKGVFEEQWDIKPEDGEKDLDLLDEWGYLKVFKSTDKGYLITTPDIEINIDQHLKEFNAAILLSDEDEIDDIAGFQFINQAN